MSLTVAQAKIMLELQDKMNSTVNPGWMKAGYPFLRAIIIEGAEAMEHHGWKWWKHQAIDLPQLQMELVDIWHFILSHQLLSGAGVDAIAEYLSERSASEYEQSVIVFDGHHFNLPGMSITEKLELIIGLAVVRKVNLILFAKLLADCSMSWDELFRQYIGKNVLNIFRQENGYKQGTYRKIWSGREDNEHLVEIMNSLDANSSEFMDLLRTNLQCRYKITD
jgi:dimeric dUTPase (all-alpha-NTP-PPase superfamily)